MPETPETADDIRTIRYRIESIETTQHLLLRGQSKGLISDLLEVFSKDPNLRDVYLALDVPRNQTQIMEHLGSSGISISQPTVSRKLTLLGEEGLIQREGADAGGLRWERKPVVENVLRLSKHLKKQ